MRVSSWLLVGVAALAMTAPVAARNPRLERLSLSSADMRSAAAGLLRQADLANVPPGWRSLSTTPDNGEPVCAWQNYSAYTLTGRAVGDFQPVKVGDAGFIGSSVDVYRSAADALGKFTVDLHPGTASCEGEALRKAFGATLKTVSARQLQISTLGEHAVGYEFVYAQAKRSPSRIFVDLIEFVRGRDVALLETTSFNKAGNTATRLSLARIIDGRLK
jgi:hypothetical protein